MQLGYHSAGLLHYDVPKIIEELTQIGYTHLALRPRQGVFDPNSPEFSRQLVRVIDALHRHPIQMVIDADASYLHDPYVRFPPSLASSDESERKRARDWLQRLIEFAPELRSSLVVFTVFPSHYDTTNSISTDALDRLGYHLQELAEIAQKRQLRVALRPAQRTSIASLAHFERVLQWLPESSWLGVAADIGEMLNAGEFPVGQRLSRIQPHLECVYVCDRSHSTVGDVLLGQGEVDVRRIVRTLREQAFSGPIVVRIEGRDEMGLSAAKQAYEWLKT
jgi:sugar phosphate isomerase/epimerase